MPEPTLSLRELNRATLARQMLLAKETITPAKAIERLAGLQAQLARPPYVGLWSRVAGFTRDKLTRAIQRHEVVRATLMRATLHLFSAKDYRRLRPCLQPMLDKGMKSVAGKHLGDMDLAPVLAAARAHLARPRTFDELRRLLHAEFPRVNERALGYAVRCSLPLVQVPDDGHDWGYHGAACFTVAESWLDAAIDGDRDPAELVRRYLAAFGPATAADAQTWSGLPSLKATFAALRPKLSVFRDERGRELFDLPGAPRPDGDTAAPVRFLPEYDNLVLGHADRSRMMTDEARRAIFRGNNLQILPSFLVDGFVAGTWAASANKRLATLEITALDPLSRRVRTELETEGDALLRFLEPGAERREVRF
jgi:hypothetical protein